MKRDQSRFLTSQLTMKMMQRDCSTLEAQTLPLIPLIEMEPGRRVLVWTMLPLNEAPNVRLYVHWWEGNPTHSR